MDDEMPGVNADNVFAVVDLTEDGEFNVIEDLWKHPGIKDTINRLNRLARVHHQLGGGQIVNRHASRLNIPPVERHRNHMSFLKERASSLMCLWVNFARSSSNL